MNSHAPTSRGFARQGTSTGVWQGARDLGQGTGALRSRTCARTGGTYNADARLRTVHSPLRVFSSARARLCRLHDCCLDEGLLDCLSASCGFRVSRNPCPCRATALSPPLWAASTEATRPWNQLGLARSVPSVRNWQSISFPSMGPMDGQRNMF